MLLPSILVPLVALGLAAQAPAAPAPASAVTPARTRMLVFDVKPNGGVPTETAENITGLMAAILSEDPRLEVLAGPDLRSMLEIEGQKAALGCASDGACLAEVAGALNAQLVLVGDVGFLGSLINLNMSLYDQGKASNIGRRAVQASSLDGLPAALRPALATLVVQALGAQSAEPVASSSSSSGPGVLPWVVAGAGGLAAVTGAIFMVVGALPAGQIADLEKQHVAGDPDAFANAVQLQKDWYDSGLAPGLLVGGAALAVVGAGAIVGGVMWSMGGAE